jgi:transposase InsO family protein
MVGPAAKRAAVAHLQAVMSLSERRACSIVGADRKMVRYRSSRRQDAELRSRLRDELLNETLFFDLDDARAKIANWVTDYNIRRPHSSLKYLTPAAYAAHLTATDDRLRNPDQLRRSSVAPPAPLGVQIPETQTAAG